MMIFYLNKYSEVTILFKTVFLLYMLNIYACPQWYK